MNYQNSTTANDLIEQVTADKLDAIISQNRFNIIDVRSPKAIQNQGNIPGAINLPFETVEEGLTTLIKNGSHSNFKPGNPFLFCCTGGVMSYMAAIKAQKNGLDNLYNLEGGHAAWIAQSKTRASNDAA
jgi:rhodanese-related sulfurtransferase